MVNHALYKRIAATILVFVFAINHQVDLSSRFETPDIDKLVSEDSKIVDCTSLEECDLKNSGANLQTDFQETLTLLVVACSKFDHEEIKPFDPEYSPIAYRSFLSHPLPERGPPSAV